MLKQSAFFKRLKRKNLTVQQYYILYNLYSEPKLSDATKKMIIDKYKGLRIYLTADCKLNSDGTKLIKSMEALFKSQKQLKAVDLLGDNYAEMITEYVETFPTGKLPNGKYARGDKKGIEENFKWFFQEYDYDWETILSATDKYVEEFRKDNFKYMRTALYFIKKLREGIIESDLATYCQAYLDGEIEEKIVHKRKVV